MNWIAILVAILCSLLVPVSGFMALFAPMAFDAPDSAKSPGKWGFVLGLWLSPFSLLWAAIYAWKAIGRGAWSEALQYCGLGLLPFIIALVLLQLNWLEPKS